MAKINTLTPEQRAAMPAFARRWIEIGTCTEPADRSRAEAAIRTMYSQAGLSSPQIVWCGSPLSMCLSHYVLKQKASVWASVGDSVRASVGASVRASVWASVRDSVGASVRASVGASVSDSVGASVRDSVRDSVGASVGDSVSDSVRDSVGASVEASVYGQHDAAWLSFYAFFRDCLGLEQETAKLGGLIELSQSAGWAIPLDGLCLVSERHSVCRLDDGGVIHSESGPAILYPDGFAVHAWHGVRVPAHWIEAPDAVDPAEVLAAKNVEQRAAGCAILGWARMAPKLGMKVLDGDPATKAGALVQMTLPGVPDPELFLMAACPRNGTICEGVPPISEITGKPIRTAHDAQAWSYGLSPSEYRTPEVRT